MLTGPSSSSSEVVLDTASVELYRAETCLTSGAANRGVGAVDTAVVRPRAAAVVVCALAESPAKKPYLIDTTDRSAEIARQAGARLQPLRSTAEES